MYKFRVKKANSLLENIIGLLQSSKPYPILLSTRFGIHTFGMKYPIDIIILDKQNRVKSLKENLKPWRFYFWNFKYNKVLELPAGAIKKETIKKGIKIELI